MLSQLLLDNYCMAILDNSQVLSSIAVKKSIPNVCVINFSQLNKHTSSLKVLENRRDMMDKRETVLSDTALTLKTFIINSDIGRKSAAFSYGTFYFMHNHNRPLT